MKVVLELLVLSCLFAQTSSFFDFLKGQTTGRTKDIDTQAVKQKQQQKEKMFLEQVKLLDKIKPMRGVPGHLSSKYSESIFVCDGQRRLQRQVINDGFCDCSDGTDEPGTSACSNSVFYCLNDGYRTTQLTSSRVDDQICDCCDGSDEGKTILIVIYTEYVRFLHRIGIFVTCPNTCKKAFERERQELERKTAAYRSGSKERAMLIEKIKKEKTATASELPSLNGIIRYILSCHLIMYPLIR